MFCGNRETLLSRKLVAYLYFLTNTRIKIHVIFMIKTSESFMRVRTILASSRSAACGWLLAITLFLSLQTFAQAQAVLSAGDSADGYSAESNTSGDMATAQMSPEKMGDSLAAQGRYLAAVRAYAQIAHPSAVVWKRLAHCLPDGL